MRMRMRMRMKTKIGRSQHICKYKRHVPDDNVEYVFEYKWRAKSGEGDVDETTIARFDMSSVIVLWCGIRGWCHGVV